MGSVGCLSTISCIHCSHLIKSCWYNKCQKEIEQKALAEGLYVRPRYSPGYGDLSLEYQSDFLQVLEAAKKIGIVLSEGGVMIPEKSVTAVMGLSREQTRCHIDGCESCENKNCAYRRQN